MHDLRGFSTLVLSFMSVVTKRDEAGTERMGKNIVIMYNRIL